jgi:hypothetical protein
MKKAGNEGHPKADNKNLKDLSLFPHAKAIFASAESTAYIGCETNQSSKRHLVSLKQRSQIKQ